MFTHPFLGETPPIFENTHILACLGSRLVSDRTDPLRLCDELHTEGRRPTVSFCWLVGFQSWEFPRDFWSFVGVLEEILHHNWLVVSNIFYFQSDPWGRFPFWTNIFPGCWNHQLVLLLGLLDKHVYGKRTTVSQLHVTWFAFSHILFDPIACIAMFTHICLNFMVHVGKYTSPMDAMGLLFIFKQDRFGCWQFVYVIPVHWMMMWYLISSTYKKYQYQQIF